MPQNSKTRKITLNIDMGLIVAGFESSATATPAHHRIAKHYSSPLLMGPPLSELLLEMATHMFTEDEADLAQHLRPLWPLTAEQVARKAHRPVEEARRILDHLALKKNVLLGYGDPRKYAKLPIVPGTFELTLMTPDLSTRNAWHRKFAELFERLWDTGYFADYPGHPKAPSLRYLPTGRVIDTLYEAWPSDKLEQVLEPYHDFAIGHCQCRMAMQLVGKGCGRETMNCVGMGPTAKAAVTRGMMRSASREEVIEVKLRADQDGMVSFAMNAANPKLGNGSCSCCGCCCHGLRALKSFNAPGLISRPHFTPAKDSEKCTLCRKCVKACQMEAWSIVNEDLVFSRARCIGCGLCVTACKPGALRLEEAEKSAPYIEDFRKALVTLLPNFFANSVRLWAKRLMIS